MNNQQRISEIISQAKDQGGRNTRAVELGNIIKSLPLEIKKIILEQYAANGARPYDIKTAEFNFGKSEPKQKQEIIKSEIEFNDNRFSISTQHYYFKFMKDMIKEQANNIEFN